MARAAALCAAAVLVCAAHVAAAVTPPGPDPSYSGYIKVPNTKDSHLFYWLCDSRGTPETDPLVLCVACASCAARRAPAQAPRRRARRLRRARGALPAAQHARGAAMVGFGADASLRPLPRRSWLTGGPGCSSELALFVEARSRRGAPRARAVALARPRVARTRGLRQRAPQPPLTRPSRARRTGR